MMLQRGRNTNTYVYLALKLRLDFIHQPVPTLFIYFKCILFNIEDQQYATCNKDCVPKKLLKLYLQEVVRVIRIRAASETDSRTNATLEGV